MSDLSRAWTIDNLRRAWQWIRSNPDRAYKGYFRQLYSVYASADEALLDNLRNRLNRRVFVPSNAGKVFFPKPSGILRPYTLLAIEDQIVYQAMANVVAERLLPHVRSRYNKQVFGHLYAGSSSGWFYRKWSDGYKVFNTAAEEAFKNGYTWTASFDLTAFYDSIDHNVLRHMLGEIGLDEDFKIRLTDFLAQWTATSTQIYHNHGIPQGPLSSGLIAEVGLKHFDSQRLSGFDVKYFRYVDDIRLFAKKEEHLRHALVALDRISKDVGLFPQSGKIHIHLVKDIADELKSVSNPIEPVLSTPATDQNALRKRIVELTKRDFKVTNPTRFKFLLAKASPSTTLMDRLWRIYEHAPHYYLQVAGHLSKFDEIPVRHANRLIVEIEKQELYPAIRAAFIQACVGRLPSGAIPKAKTVLKKLWQPKVAQADMSDALWRWLCYEKHLTNRQMSYGFKSQLSPWLQMRLHFGMQWDDISTHQRSTWLNHTMRSQHADVALSAAWLCGMYEITPEKPTKDINPLAKLMLKEFGLMRRGDSSVCGIRLAILEMTDHDIPIRWKKFFGKSYKRAEAQITTCKGYFKTNPTSWVNAIDVFNDLWLDALYRHDTTLGAYTLGNIGGVLKSTRLKTDYPAISKLANQLHEKRLESDLSHAEVKATKTPTKPIKFDWLKIGARILLKGAQELHGKKY
jgi:hypothetical protein